MIIALSSLDHDKGVLHSMKDKGNLGIGEGKNKSAARNNAVQPTAITHIRGRFQQS